MNVWWPYFSVQNGSYRDEHLNWKHLHRQSILHQWMALGLLIWNYIIKFTLFPVTTGNLVTYCLTERALACCRQSLHCSGPVSESRSCCSVVEKQRNRLVVHVPVGPGHALRCGSHPTIKYLQKSFLYFHQRWFCKNLRATMHVVFPTGTGWSPKYTYVHSECVGNESAI